MTEGKGNRQSSDGRLRSVRRFPPMPRILAAMLVFLFGLASCGTTLGTIPFSAPGQGDATVVLDAESDVSFWTDFDATYDGEVDAKYDVQLLQDGAVVANATCDPLRYGGVQVCISRVMVGDRHHAHCRMRCTAHVTKSGPTIVHAVLAIKGAPVPLRLERADLIIKQ